MKPHGSQPSNSSSWKTDRIIFCFRYLTKKISVKKLCRQKWRRDHILLLTALILKKLLPKRDYYADVFNFICVPGTNMMTVELKLCKSDTWQFIVNADLKRFALKVVPRTNFGFFLLENLLDRLIRHCTRVRPQPLHYWFGSSDYA